MGFLPGLYQWHLIFLPDLPLSRVFQKLCLLVFHFGMIVVNLLLTTGFHLSSVWEIFFRHCFLSLVSLLFTQPFSRMWMVNIPCLQILEPAPLYSAFCFFFFFLFQSVIDLCFPFCFSTGVDYPFAFAFLFFT